MSSEEYSISWNDHHRNVMGVLGRYLDKETLVDCTIAAEGECLKAHRLVLSACSTYFELLFGREMKKEKVVVLEDLKFKDLKSLIAFMYDGQVTIPKDRLGHFVRAAKFLQIRGLPSELTQNSLREATEMSEVDRKKDLASPLSHNHTCYSAISGERSDLQWVSSKNKTEDERPSTYKQTNLSQENAPLPSLSILDSDPNRERAVFPAEKVPSAEPKEEVDVEDTPIWESGDENTSAVTDLSSATGNEEIQNELTPVLHSVSRSSFGSSPRALEKELTTSTPRFSFVTATIPSSTNTASLSLPVPNVPTEQGGCAMEYSSLCVQGELDKQSICVKNKPVVKTEVIPAVSLHKESVLEPMHEVWVEELRSWESEEGITGIRSIDTCSQEATIRDLDAAVVTSGSNQCAVWPDVDAHEVKEETEVDECCIKQECKNIDVDGGTVDKVVESEQQRITEVDEDNVVKAEHVMQGQMMVEMVGRTQFDAVKQSEAEDEDSAPLSERIPKMLGEKSHRCPRCPDGFCTVGDLWLHVKKLHEKERSNRCKVCMATFGYRSHLMRHIRRHCGERPFKCEVCERSFCERSSLTIHKRIHTGESPFLCDICSMSFSKKACLTVHKRIHTGERPFQCDVCKRSFMCKNSVTRHMCTHSGERPFVCDVCAKSFSLKTHLSRHKQIHTGERPFQCEVCKKSFSQLAHLTVHKRIHTGERPFQCYVCKKSFSNNSHLIRHMRTH